MVGKITKWIMEKFGVLGVVALYLVGLWLFGAIAIAIADRLPEPEIDTSAED